MDDNYSKAPRLYVDQDLIRDAQIILAPEQSHYLLSVMRKNSGDPVRIFNGRDGEYVGELGLQSKKIAVLTTLKKIKDQGEQSRRVHLYFAPIKKDRLGFLIEKSVELGVTDFHPIATQYTQHSKMNAEKIQKQIIEAAEQCERLDIPTLHALKKLMDIQIPNNAFAAIERVENTIFHNTDTISDIAIFVGPEGGWSPDEQEYLFNHQNVTSVSLGKNILRAETATLFMLSRIG